MRRCLPQAWTWEQRRARAAELARRRPEARELLEFYRELAATQALLAERAKPTSDLLRCHREARGEIPQGLPVGRFWVVLRAVAGCGPQVLAQAAQGLLEAEAPRQQELLRRFFRGSRPVGRDVLVRQTQAADPELVLAGLFVQPYAELEAQAVCTGGGPAGADGAGGASPKPHPGEAVCWPEQPGVWCPLCGSAAQVGYLVDREGEQGGLFLQCGLCGASWRRLRLVCPSCGAAGERLSYFQAEGLPHLSLGACEGCGYYLKVVDLRKDGLAVPCVDDLASVSLDLWAADQGLRRPYVGLAGL